MSQLDVEQDADEQTSLEKSEIQLTTEQESPHILKRNSNLAVLSWSDLVFKFEQEQENTQQWIADLEAGIKETQDEFEAKKKVLDTSKQIIHRLTLSVR